MSFLSKFSGMMRYDADFNEKWKSRKKSANTFITYCTQLCRESLITGFPVIASTRSIFRKGLKSFVFVLCICGFLFQTTDFLSMYNGYPTIVNIQVEKPDVVHLPAVSLCNRNRIRRKAMCTQIPTVCTWSSNRSDFCFAYPRYCISWQVSEKDTVIGIPDFRNIVGSNNRTLEYIQALGQRQKDLIAACLIRTGGNKNCKNYVSVLAVDSKGFPNYCVAIESLWGQPNAHPQEIQITGQMAILLTLHPEEYVDYYELVQAHIFAHDPYSITNPMKLGITLEAGISYDIFVDQRISIRLPAPYDTNCTDYLKQWRENGGHGPLTGKECAEKCKMESMLQSVGCVAQSISLPHNLTICDDENTYPSEATQKKCSKGCSEACREVSYILRTEVNSKLYEQCNNDANCMKKNMLLNFIFNRLEVETFLNEPKFASVEMFSYIGGYMGMWLGISLVALFDFVETLFYLLLYPCRSRKRFRKTGVHRSLRNL